MMKMSVEMKSNLQDHFDLFYYHWRTFREYYKCYS